MDKEEISQEIRKTLEILEMDAYDYIKRIKERHNRTLQLHDVYPYRTGEVISHLEYILKSIEEAGNERNNNIY